MLNNIKSYYITKIIFTFMDEKQKLKIIKYNKTLQKYTDICIINYMYFSQSYIIYEQKGRGKEYDGYNDILLFEGEYLNGKRNGKGKEYYEDGNLNFEGEYLNGEGKEYNFLYK